MGSHKITLFTKKTGDNRRCFMFHFSAETRQLPGSAQNARGLLESRKKLLPRLSDFNDEGFVAYQMERTSLLN